MKLKGSFLLLLAVVAESGPRCRAPLKASCHAASVIGFHSASIRISSATLRGIPSAITSLIPTFGEYTH